MRAGRKAERAAVAGLATLWLVATIGACAHRPSLPPQLERILPATATPSPSPTRRPKPRPSPSPSPSPSSTPAYAPTSEPVPPALPAPLPAGSSGDVTRAPLTRAIDSRTPAATARALEAAERAQIELQAGTTDRAIEIADEALRISPAAVPAWVVRARALLAEGSPGLARADLEHAATLSPDVAWMAEIVALTGATYEADGNTEAALSSYRRAVVMFPANQTARQGLRRLSAP